MSFVSLSLAPICFSAMEIKNSYLNFGRVKTYWERSIVTHKYTFFKGLELVQVPNTVGLTQGADVAHKMMSAGQREGLNNNCLSQLSVLCSVYMGTVGVCWVPAFVFRCFYFILSELQSPFCDVAVHTLLVSVTLRVKTYTLTA